MARESAVERVATRDRLIAEAGQFIHERGVSGWSLRELAAYCGTTHGHLLYHFQSRERLLVDVLLDLRRRVNLDLVPGMDGRPLSEEILEDFAKLTDEANLDDFRAFFYVAGLALNDPGLSDFFTGLVSTWVDIPGATEQDRARRRVAIAAMRGLLLDLLATGDRDGVDRAIKELAALLEHRGRRSR
jgi:AcrR family transcriptional regulator